MNKDYWYNVISKACPTEFLVELAGLSYEEIQPLSMEQKKEIIFNTLDKLTEKQVKKYVITY